MKIFLILVVLIIIFLLILSKSLPNKVHIKRIKIKHVSDFEKIYKSHKPVILTSSDYTLNNKTKAMNWSDEYILNTLKNREIKVERSKTKEFNPSDPNIVSWKDKITFQSFIKNYKKESLYWAEEDIPEELKNEIETPLVSKVFDKYDLGLSDVKIFWGYNGNITRLHNDEYENLLCLYSGQKDLILFPPEDEKNLYIDYNSTPLDLYSINYFRYPNFRKCTSYVGSLKKGEILYIPEGWYHQIKSHGKNVAFAFFYIPKEEII